MNSIGGERKERRDARTSTLCTLAPCFLLLFFIFTSHAAPLFQNTESKNEMAAAKFPKLVAEYLQDLHSRHPAVAAASGIHAWDAQLEDYSGQAIAAEV